MRHDLGPNLNEGFRDAFRFFGRMGRKPFWFWMGLLHLIMGLAFSLWFLENGGNANVTINLGWLDPLKELERFPAIKAYLDYLTVTWPTAANVLPLPNLQPYFSGWVRPLSLILFILSIAAITRRVRDTGYPFKTSILLCFWPVLSPLLALAPVAGSWRNDPVSEPTAATFMFVLPAIVTYLSILTSILALLILTAPTFSGPNPSEAQP